MSVTPVHPPPIAYPSASNAFQNRARTEFNNKRAAHFEIDLLRPFSRRVSLSLFPPLDLAGERWWDGFIPFLPFWKTRRAAISKYSPFAFEINLSSEFAFTFPRSFDEANAFESVVRSAMKRYVRAPWCFYFIVGLHRREKTILEWSELRKEVNRDWIYRNRINRIFIYLCTNKAISFEISSDLLEKYRSFLSYQIIRTYIYIENIIRFERWSIHFIGRIIS